MPLFKILPNAAVTCVFVEKASAHKNLLNISCANNTCLYVAAGRVAGLDSKLSKSAAQRSSILRDVMLPRYDGGGCKIWRDPVVDVMFFMSFNDTFIPSLSKADWRRLFVGNASSVYNSLILCSLIYLIV